LLNDIKVPDVFSLCREDEDILTPYSTDISAETHMSLSTNVDLVVGTYSSGNEYTFCLNIYVA
jgi:hypothetical protein